MADLRGGTNVGGYTALHTGIFNVGDIKGIYAGSDSAKPAESGSKIIYITTDNGNKIYYDTGTWVIVGGGDPYSIPAGAVVQAQGGVEGGEIYLAKAASGTTLAGNVGIDAYVNSIRFFENGGTSRGAYIDITTCGGGAGSKIYHAGNLGSWSYNTTPTLSGTTRTNLDGYLYATRVYGAVFNDYAEYFEKGEDAEPGDLISAGNGGYFKSGRKYDTMVVGVYSDQYFQCIGGKGDGEDDKNYIPIGLAGRVKAKVKGKVRKGDLLTSSGTPGVAMKCSRLMAILKPGCIIGKALEDHNGPTIDRIETFIMNR